MAASIMGGSSTTVAAAEDDDADADEDDDSSSDSLMRNIWNGDDAWRSRRDASAAVGKEDATLKVAVVGGANASDKSEKRHTTMAAI